VTAGELGAKQRRLLVVVELYVRRHGQPPTWRELRALVGVGELPLVHLMRSLRDRGAVTFDESPRSLRVTPHGLRAALTPPAGEGRRS
jgi:hypothetical protein